jgi:hypothetical protein
MDEEDGCCAKADSEKSIFIVVEAKRTSKLSDASSEAELIGQLKSQLIRRYVYSISDYAFWFVALPSHFSAFMCSLTVSRTTSHIGALRDGKTWRFYYIVQDKFYQATLIADTKEQTSLVLGICPNLL